LLTFGLIIGLIFRLTIGETIRLIFGVVVNLLFFGLGLLARDRVGTNFLWKGLIESNALLQACSSYGMRSGSPNSSLNTTYILSYGPRLWFG